jgi:hypothetical protein
MDEVTAQYRVHPEMVSKDRVRMEQTILTVMDSICERFPDIRQSVRADELASARSRIFRLIAEGLEKRGRIGEAREYWTAAYETNGDVDASLALLGLSPKWRRRVRLRQTRLGRILSWYWYKVGAFATRASVGKKLDS